ncbi:MAG: radical SAM family heme chaperone HemW [Ignavibacteria bacterium]|nr:radical SAM family heme chaperone HemW [Ignavibacteria bacterium]
MPGLYVHVPFCETKCVYCDFYSVEGMDREAAFLTRCVEEIDRRGDALQAKETFTSVFFGGGTPSLLRAEQLGALLSALRRNFTVAEDAETTVECNPGTVTRGKLEDYRALGVNRLSFGVQSFHDDDLRFLSRIHTAREAEDGIALAREAGFENVNLDLMFSLPGQTPARWLHNLERARALGTTHLSCYSLTVEKGTPLAVMVERGEVRTASEDSDAQLYELTMDTLASWGFAQYEVSNYALEGYACRHNLTYWRHEDYLGFGPSAHSTWKRRRSWNVSSIRAWAEQIAAGGDAFSGGEDLTDAMLRAEHISLRLRSEGIRRSVFQKMFGSDIVDDNPALLRQCEASGLLEISDDFVRLTRKGMLVCEEICLGLT